VWQHSSFARSKMFRGGQVFAKQARYEGASDLASVVDD
jgi:hypothetical protein